MLQFLFGCAMEFPAMESLRVAQSGGHEDRQSVPWSRLVIPHILCIGTVRLNSRESFQNDDQKLKIDFLRNNS